MSASTLYTTRQATYGSVAYDMGRVMPDYGYEPEVEREAERPAARPKTTVKTAAKTRTKTKAKEAKVLSVFGVVGTIVSAVLIVAVIFSYIKLNALSVSANELQTELDELVEEEAKLRITYEQVFDLSEVEEYAMYVLGMVQPSNVTAVSVENVVEDKAVILESDASDGMSVFESISTFLSSILEYFG